MYLAISIFLHMAVFSLFAILERSSPSLAQENLALVQSSIRVDIVAMPKMTLKEIKSIDDFVGSKNQKTNFKDLVKKLGQKEVFFEEKKKKKKNYEGLKKLLLAGNKISTGHKAIGQGQGKKIQKDWHQYITGLPDLVRPYWKLPSYLMQEKLNCRIQVFINSRGELVRSVIVQKSGSEEFDQRATQSIMRAAPFPPPRPLIVSRLLKGDAILGFPL